MSQFMDAFKQWYDTRHDYAVEWKKRNPGGKIMGCFCSYVPEEILYAVDVLPVRMLGSHEAQNVTEPHIFGMYCPFCRDVLAQGLQHRFDYIDGIMIAQSCIHIRQAFTSWDIHVPAQFSYYLRMPHFVQNPRRAIPFLREEYEDFIEKVEKWTGKKVTDEALQKGIDICNRARGLMRELYELRKDGDPHVSGLESMYAAAALQTVDKREFSDYLEKVLPKIKGESIGRDPGPRLMIVGSEDDDTVFVNMVESCGASIVIDDHCTGSRFFWNKVESNGDLLTDVARRYVQRPACPTKDWPARLRKDHVLALAKDWNCAGVVLLQQKFCDPHELDIPVLKRTLEGAGIRTLFLELDVTVPVGQFKIRVEAFLEMLRQEDLF